MYKQSNGIYAFHAVTQIVANPVFCIRISRRLRTPFHNKPLSRRCTFVRIETRALALLSHLVNFNTAYFAYRISRSFSDSCLLTACVITPSTFYTFFACLRSCLHHVYQSVAAWPRCVCWTCCVFKKLKPNVSARWFSLVDAVWQVGFASLAES